jgi:Ulp1 family protease
MNTDFNNENPINHRKKHRAVTTTLRRRTSRTLDIMSLHTLKGNYRKSMKYCGGMTQ